MKEIGLSRRNPLTSDFSIEENALIEALMTIKW